MLKIDIQERNKNRIEKVFCTFIISLLFERLKLEHFY